MYLRYGRYLPPSTGVGLVAGALHRLLSYEPTFVAVVCLLYRIVQEIWLGMAREHRLQLLCTTTSHCADPGSTDCRHRHLHLSLVPVSQSQSQSQSQRHYQFHCPNRRRRRLPPPPQLSPPQPWTVQTPPAPRRLLQTLAAAVAVAVAVAEGIPPPWPASRGHSPVCRRPTAISPVRIAMTVSLVPYLAPAVFCPSALSNTTLTVELVPICCPLSSRMSTMSQVHLRPPPEPGTVEPSLPHCPL